MTGLVKFRGGTPRTDTSTLTRSVPRRAGMAYCPHLVRWSIARRRSTTLQLKRLSKSELQIGALLYPERGYWRPTIRADCREVERPCLFVQCRHHLYLDVSPATGSIRFNFPDLEPSEMVHSCVLDLADGEGMSLAEVGAALGITSERARQIETQALGKLILTWSEMGEK